MTIASKLNNIKQTLPPKVKLVTVSKFHPASSVAEAYEAGQRIFGESRMQELQAKYTALPKDIEWHFIGHLQTNKIKSILPYTHTIQSVDSIKLLLEIEKQASAAKKPINCLLEIHIAQEESKYGFSYNDCLQFFNEGLWKNFEQTRIIGLMGMATFTNDQGQIHREFQKLNHFFKEIKESFFANDPSFCELSMGMSDDYPIAVAEGATMVRVGSSIFGERNLINYKSL